MKLSDDAARTLPPDCQEPLSSIDVPKLTIAIYPRHVAEVMTAHVSLPLKELKLTVGIIAPKTKHFLFVLTSYKNITISVQQEIKGQNLT